MPSGATHVGNFGKHTSITESHLQRLACSTERRFDNNRAFVQLQDSFDQVARDLTSAYHIPKRSPKTLAENAVAEQFLRMFCLQVFLPKAYGQETSITVDDVLSCPP